MFKDYIPIPKLSGIELSETSLNLIIGETSSLSILPQPTTANISGKSVTWESKDETVATVNSNGVITAVGTGSTTITAIVSDYTAECIVTVVRPLNLNFKETAITMPTQQIKQLTVTSDQSLEGKTIMWHSSDNSVANIDENGVITALKEGTTTITATIEQQVTETFVMTASATCNVTVAGQLGDVDRDNAITAYDAYKTLEISVEYSINTKIDEQNILRTDVNKNGIPESDDAYNILRYSVKLIKEF